MFNEFIAVFGFGPLAPASVGDMVRVKEPFTKAFPDVYVIEYVKEDGTCVICEDRDFDPIYLERVG